jgi:hypothetical protein
VSSLPHEKVPVNLSTPSVVAMLKALARLITLGSAGLVLVTCVEPTDRCLVDGDCSDGRVCSQQICVRAVAPGAPACLGDQCDGTQSIAVARVGGEGALVGATTWALLDRAERWGFIELADVTGDGRDDLIAVERNAQSDAPGVVWVAVGAAGHFGAPVSAGSASCQETQSCRLADVDGDGRADLIPVRPAGPRRQVVLVSRGNPTTFDETAPVRQECLSSDVCRAADVDGDAHADLIMFLRGRDGVPGAGQVLVSLSAQASFAPSTLWHTRFCLEEEECHVGDIDGDGRADLVLFAKENRPGDKRIEVAFSNGTAFRADPQAAFNVRLCGRGEICLVSDVDGDRKYDFVVFARGAAGAVWRLRSLGRQSELRPELWGEAFCLQNQSCQVARLQSNGTAQPVSLPLPTR